MSSYLSSFFLVKSQKTDEATVFCILVCNGELEGPTDRRSDQDLLPYTSTQNAPDMFVSKKNFWFPPTGYGLSLPRASHPEFLHQGTDVGLSLMKSMPSGKDAELTCFCKGSEDAISSMPGRLSSVKNIMPRAELLQKICSLEHSSTSSCPAQLPNLVKVFSHVQELM